MAENFDARVLAGIEFVDVATTARLLQPLGVSSETAQFQRNQSNRYVVVAAEGLEAYEAEFMTAPNMPPLSSLSFDVEVEDLSGMYLPRVFTFSLPRDADPLNGGNANSVFQPLRISLFRNVSAATLGNWSLVRVSVRDNNNQAVAGAFLLVRRTEDDEIIGRGMSNQMGETLIVVPGIPITRFSESDEEEEGGDGEEEENEESPVLVSEVAANVELSIPDPLQWPGNPDLLESAHAGQIVESQAINLRTGRTETLSFSLT